MSKNKDLYHNYITGNCDDSDKEKISEQLRQFNIEEDAQELSQCDTDIDEDLSRRLLSNIHYNTVDKYKIRKRKFSRMAAGIIVIVGFVIGVTQFLKNKSDVVKVDSFLDNKTTTFNHSDTILILKLPDNSIVSLSPNSSISYKAKFEGRRRDIHLHGTAIFKVSRDPSRPFNVYSGKLVTTALGTEFKVSEYHNNILIKLLEGKILVKKSMPSSDHFYLLAGNAINYNIANDIFTPILNIASSQIKESGKREQKPTQREDKTMHLNLNNIPMADALDKIAQQYNVEIEYSPTDVSDINIIANFDRSQPVERILNNIALMNQLDIRQLDDKDYIIRKQN